jgi:hypothetical protein
MYIASNLMQIERFINNRPRPGKKPRLWFSNGWTQAQMEIGKTLIVVGVVLVAAGLLWIGGARLGLGHLPGDIIIERENFRVYLPIATSIFISVVLSLIFWLISRL